MGCDLLVLFVRYSRVLYCFCDWQYSSARAPKGLAASGPGMMNQAGAGGGVLSGWWSYATRCMSVDDLL
jgi:hypothetical protein